MNRIHYRLSFMDAEGEKFPGPVFEAPEDAVEVAGVELWMVPEEAFHKSGDVRIENGQVEVFNGESWEKYRKLGS